MELPNSKIIAIANALALLDPVKDKPPFKFPGKTIAKLASCRYGITGALEAFEKARGVIADRYADEEGKLVGRGAVEYAKELEDLLKQTEEVKLRTVALADLDLDRNSIPPNALAALIGTVVDEDEIDKFVA